MDAWGREQLQPWLDMRREMPVGPLLCVINGTTRGRHWSPAAARAELRPFAHCSTRCSVLPSALVRRKERCRRPAMYEAFKVGTARRYRSWRTVGSAIQR
jgi:hypothetical protein